MLPKSNLYFAPGQLLSRKLSLFSCHSPETVPSTTPSQCTTYKSAIKLSTTLDTVQGGDLVDMHQFDTGKLAI